MKAKLTLIAAIGFLSISALAQTALPTLTLAQAEKIAVQQNPHVEIARLVALAEGQVKREARAADLPTLTGNLTAVDAHEGGRITAGAL